MYYNWLQIQVELLPSFIDMTNNGDVSSNNGLEDIWILKVDFEQKFSDLNSYNIINESIEITNLLGQKGLNNKDVFKISIDENGQIKKHIDIKK